MLCSQKPTLPQTPNWTLSCLPITLCSQLWNLRHPWPLQNGKEGWKLTVVARSIGATKHTFRFTNYSLRSGVSTGIEKEEGLIRRVIGWGVTYSPLTKLGGTSRSPSPIPLPLSPPKTILGPNFRVDDDRITHHHVDRNSWDAFICVSSATVKGE